MRLLLVDDDPSDIELTRVKLERSGLIADVQTAETLAAARSLLEEKDFDCILCDLHLPDGNGIDLLPEVDNAAFIVLTGSEGDDVGAQEIGRGAADYLEKSRLDAYWLKRSILHAVERTKMERYRQHMDQVDGLITVGRLAGAVSHEMLNPAALLSANLEHMNYVLETDTRPVAQDIKELTGECLEALDRITTVARQLRRSSVDRDQLLERVVGIDLAKLVNESLTLLRTQIRHNADFRVQTDTPLPGFIGRPGRLTQALSHLLMNAYEAVEGCAERVIALRLEATDTGVVLHVEDSGPGLSEAARIRACEPFFTTKANRHNTGLGLAFCQEAAIEHGGELTFSTSELGGLKASLEIPVPTPFTATELRQAS
ncbi:MAG: ATP-binding protein [Myxococcota bacterium]